MKTLLKNTLANRFATGSMVVAALACSSCSAKEVGESEESALQATSVRSTLRMVLDHTPASGSSVVGHRVTPDGQQVFALEWTLAPCIDASTCIRKHVFRMARRGIGDGSNELVFDGSKVPESAQPLYVNVLYLSGAIAGDGSVVNLVETDGTEGPQAEWELRPTTVDASAKAFKRLGSSAPLGTAYYRPSAATGLITVRSWEEMTTFEDGAVHTTLKPAQSSDYRGFAAISANGRTCVVEHDDEEQNQISMAFFDCRTGKEFAKLPVTTEHAVNAVSPLKFTGDNFFTSVEMDKVSAFVVGDGKVSRGPTVTLPSGVEDFKDAAFSPDAKRLVFITTNGLWSVIDVATGQLLMPLRDDGFHTQQTEFVSANRFLIRRDSGLRVYEFAAP